MSAPGCELCGSTRARRLERCANDEQCWRRQCANRIAASRKTRREHKIGQCPAGLKMHRGNTLSIRCCELHSGHKGRHLHATREWS